ncbi:hypothetical protein ACFV27_37145 [Streptomyces antimycoticus]|uniref:hypothetical protein n=1 Tax=Streptomyces antimycoticus TaxID=68175 RepID=UPI0036CB61A7
MKDRTRTRSATTVATPAPAPMPGRLPVDFDLVSGPVTEPLAETPTGTLVTAFGTITNVLTFPGGLTSLTIADEQGESALVGVEPHVLQMASFRAFRDLGEGDTVAVAGTVARRRSGVAVIDGLELWAVTR